MSNTHGVTTTQDSPIAMAGVFQELGWSGSCEFIGIAGLVGDLEMALSCKQAECRRKVPGTGIPQSSRPVTGYDIRNRRLSNDLAPKTVEDQNE